MGGFRDGYREDGEGYAYRSESSSSEEEDTARKPPFPAEVKLAKTRLAKARRSGDEVLEGTALMAMGELKLRSAKYARALQRAQAAMDIFPQAAGKAESVRLMVRVHLAENNTLEAYKLLEQQLPSFQRAPRDPKAIAILQLAQAEVCLALGRREQAIREADEALDTLRRLNDEAWEAVAGLTVARVSLQLKTRHLRRANKLADKALKFYKNLGDYDEEAATLVLISQLHMALQEYEDAHLFAKVAADMSRARGALSREAAGQQQIASVMLAQQGDPESAGSLAKQAVTKFRKNGDLLGEIAAHQVVASAYQAEGLVNMALEAYNEALTLARKLGHRQLISTLLDSIVKIYDPEGALDVLREEEELARRSGDVRRELEALRRVAMQQVVLERGQDAVQTAEEAVQLARGARDVRCEASAMKLVGEVSKLCGQTDEAVDGLLHARTLMKDVGDVAGQAEVLEIVVQIHEGEGSDAKAQLVVLDDCQKLFQEAGWKERAARKLLDMAKVLTRNRGAIRAVDKAREAIELFGEKDDEGKAFSADGNLELAEIMKGNIRYQRAAPECIRKAQELFRKIGDAAGQARALQKLSNWHQERDNYAEAEKVLREAVAVCRENEDRREEAQASLEVVNFHMNKIQKAEERRMELQPLLQDAIDATLESVQLFEGVGDVIQQISLLLVAAGLCVDNDDGETGQEHAEQALQLSVKEGQKHLEAHALLNVAKAHLSLHEAEDCKKCALGARELFEQLGDEDNIDQSTIVIEHAKHAPKEPKERKRKAAAKSAQQGFAPPPRGAANVQQQEAPSRSSGRARDKGRAFSSMMESLDGELKAEKEAEERQQRREDLLTRPTKASVPDQEQRKRELYSNSMANSGSQVLEAQAEDVEQEVTMADVLQTVRPDWKDKDVKSVQEKFATIGIYSIQDLYERLHSTGASGVNGRLKKAGQKQLKTETLNALFATLDDLFRENSFG